MIKADIIITDLDIHNIKLVSQKVYLHSVSLLGSFMSSYYFSVHCTELL